MTGDDPTVVDQIEDAEIDDWNAEIEDEVSATDVGSLVVYSRDWTVETILTQIGRGNIDLNPNFQRRNAWNDLKRSKLVESLIIDLPVPEIVLAEDKDNRGTFIVIDGKQRLLALAGFADPELKIWSSPKLKGLNTRSDLNGRAFKDLIIMNTETPEARQFRNASIRCTIISNYKDIAVLYDIFYRLNAGSVPLSSQELRQVLNKGDFANFLIKATNENLPVHRVLNLKGPDNRLRDAEILLRFISFSLYGDKYRGSLTPFLDETMRQINVAWAEKEPEVQALTRAFNDTTGVLLDVFPRGKVGRKFKTDGAWETRFNRALFEVQIYYASRVDPAQMMQRRADFVARFEALCLESAEFIDTIEASTKNVVKYHRRYQIFQDLVNDVFGLHIDAVPVPARN